MRLSAIFLLVAGLGIACTAHRDGLREGTTDTWVGNRYGFELTIPAGTSFGTTSLQPYRLSVRDGSSGMQAEIGVHEASRDCSEVLDGYIATIPGVQILSRGRLMLWGRPGVLARLASPRGRILATVISLRRQYCLIRIEGAAGSDDEAALDAAQRFLDNLLDGLRFT